MTTYKGVLFAINGMIVETPDDDHWEPIELGEDLDQLRKISIYRDLVWTKRVLGPCTIDWKLYENQVLVSVTTRSHDDNDRYATYSEAILQTVSYRSALKNATDITAHFRVNTESEL